jgi:hypothetical protein
MKLSSLTLISCLTVACASDELQESAALVETNVTMEDTLAAQEGWCTGLLSISDAYEKGGQSAAKQRAEQVLDAAYGYQLGAVLFKPTLTEAPQTFRTTRAGALSYFVGGDPAFPKDKGFALKGWKQCEIENAAVFLNGDTASTMGNVTFTDKQGAVTVVDKSWLFLKDDDGRMRIMQHHSSLPYRSE